MNVNTSRRGSALLIVLGMMAFIVVSAVAFSAYMRYSRLPSSYLRRTSATRLLAKAAVAEAIEKIDCAIGNNPYPGIRSRAYTYPRIGGTPIYNTWRDRVFTGTINEVTTISSDETVSTLCLEALAYIPGPFVNDARYWSRRSEGGKWNSLAFDAGRYTFTAIDVSDCYNVNRLPVCGGRTSSDIGRISPAFCFENKEHTGYDVDPEIWDDFIEKFIDEGGKKVPLISVADMNLAIQNYQPKGIHSLFGEYIKQGSNAKFVIDDSDEVAKHMAFVTDSYSKPVEEDDNTILLTEPEEQPFYRTRMETSDDAKKNDDAPDFIMANLSNKFLEKYNNLMSLEVAQLYDYLDRDSAPLSLAIPTTERVPMVTAVGVENTQLKLEVVPTVKTLSGPVNPATGTSTFTYTITKGDLTLSGDLRIQAGVVYPFKYNRGVTKTFKAQAAATITLVPESSAGELRRKDAVAPAVFTKDDWSTSQKNPEVARFGSEKTPVVVTMQSSLKTISLPTNIKEEEDACISDLMFDFNLGNIKLTGAFDEIALRPGVTMPEECKNGTFRQIVLVDTTAGGAPQQVESVANIQPVNGALSGVLAMSDDERYVPVVQVWVRILDGDNNTVDLVPACVKDDVQSSSVIPVIASRYSANRPVLRFKPNGGSSAAITSNVGNMLSLAGAQAMVPSPTAYIGDDPRFNFAPETFTAKDGFSGELKTEWLSHQSSAGAGRDGDIFMTTSDAGYMQSVYELANILKVSNSSGDMLNPNETMWKTFTSYGLNNDIETQFKNIVSGRTGYRMNPYSTDKNLWLAVFANTPLDWWAASTNDTEAVKRQMLESLDESLKYTFSEMPGAQVRMKTGYFDLNGLPRPNSLSQLADRIQKQMVGAVEWSQAFDNFGWFGDDLSSIGEGPNKVNLGVSLHTVDRKFLHGFWKECLDNRQQLFLVFVRAEPVMMGGGAKGRTPPQLGARAVALVWRDPTATTEDVSGQPRPHQTRILFYRQFD